MQHARQPQRQRPVLQPVTAGTAPKSAGQLSSAAAADHNDGSGGNISHVVTIADLDRLAADSIRQLHLEGKHVSVQVVEQLMLARLGCRQLPLVKYATDLQRLKQLQRELSRIQVYVHAYRLNPVGTVHELGQRLAESAAEARGSFDELGIGPLTKMPLVYKLFKCPSDGAVPVLWPADVISCLRACLDDPGCRDEEAKGRLKVDVFMNKLAEAHGCKDDHFRLGVMISSIPLLIQEISRARREANASLREARERIKLELHDELKAHLQSMKRHLAEALNKQTDRGVVLRRKYMHMQPFEVLQDALQCCMNYITNLRSKDKVMYALREVSKDPLASQLFQLALCSAHFSADDGSANSSHGQPAEATVATGLANTTTSTPASQQQRQRAYSQKEVFDAVKRSLARRKVELISLEALKVFEELTKQTLQVKDFVDCGHGSFIAFLCRYAKDFEDGGVSLFLSSDTGSGLWDRKKQALAFIRHHCSIVGRTGPFSTAEQYELSTGLLAQFGFTTLQELGASSMASLLSQAGQPSGSGSMEQPVLFEEACIRANVQDDSSNVAAGHDRRAALQCIVNTPLLEDVSSWTQWKVVFYEKFGDLTKFIMENHKEVQQDGSSFGDGASFGLRVILTGDGRLLRIPAARCDVNTFASCVAKADGRGAAAHLTGIACVKGITGLPSLLLASSVKRKLTEMASQSIGSYRSQQVDDCALYAPLTDFVLTAISLLPPQIAQRIARQVFIGPFADAIGSQTKAEELLHAMSAQQGLNRALERLGMVLGISCWTAPYDSRLEPQTVLDDTSKQVADALWKQSTISEDMDGSSEAQIPSDVGNIAADVNKVQEARHDISLAVDDAVTEHGQSATTRTGDDHCLAVINDIRKKYNVDCSHEESEATSNLKRQLGNSLERLSRELYNSNTHFVLELIQNADDNHYGKDTSPALLFVIDHSSIALYNNEEGFSEKDIRAISAIGMSTKGKHKQGYIGQKGIGFKSVFTVTDRPEVHSNGYHICFDRSQGNIGYILPTWVSNKPPSPPKKHLLKGSLWKTTIILPLKDESDDDHCRVQALTSSFLDFKPILLLFLHRLQQITFVIKAQKHTVVMRRQDVGKHLLQLHSGTDSDLWLVSRLQLDTAEELQVDIDSTELSLAFPVFSNSKLYEQYLSKPDKKPKKQQTFAYLPLRDYGFKFVLQADFEIPSSRQDVRHDSRWNEWLREAIPRAFMKSRELFLGLTGLDEIAATIYFLKFTPLPSEISGFFEPVAQGILEQLCRTPLMPIQGGKDVISWKLPSEVIICPREVQSVLPVSILTSKLGLFYVMPRIFDGLGEELLMSLGVKKLDCFTAVELLKAVYQEYQHDNVCFPVKYSAVWLSAMYHFLGDGYQSSAIATIAAMKLFSLSNGSTVSLSDNQAVFLPLGANDRKDSSLLDILESDLPIISKDLLGCQSELANAQVKEVLQILGVHAPTIYGIINDHIIPTLQSDAWEKKPKQIMVAYVRFLFNNWVSNRDAEWLPASRKCLRLLTTNDKLVCPAEDDIYLTPYYLNPVDLPKSYPAHRWCLITPEYAATTSSMTRQWRDFFLAHGLKELFEVESQKSVRTRTDLEKTSWQGFLELLPADAGSELELEDYDCPVLRQLIDSGEPTTLTSIYDELQRHWESKYDGAKHAVLRVPSSRRQPIQLPSTFAHALRSRRWVPCTTYVPRQLAGSTWQWSYDLRCGFDEPSAVWLDTAELRQLLDRTVTYLRGQAPSVAFTRAMGFKCELPATQLLDHLRKWAAAAHSPTTAATDGASCGWQFVTSLQHVTRVYAYLTQHAPDVCSDAFQSEALVFVPSSREQFRPDDIQAGNFFPLRSLRWTDPTGLFKEYRPEFVCESTGEKLSYAFIDQHYANLQHLFVAGLRVELEPLLRDYCLLLQHVVAQQNGKVSDQYVEHVTRLYVALGRKCITETQEGFVIDRRYASQLKSCIGDAPVFATMAGSWTRLNERLLLDDSPETGDLLRHGGAPVSFFRFIVAGVGNDVPRLNSYLMAFCEALEIRKLSSLVEREAIHEGLRQSPRAQNYVAGLLPWVHRFLLSKEAYTQLYTRLSTPSAEDGSVFPDSRLRSVYQVKSIQVVVRLKGWDECTVIRSRECDYVASDRSIYLEYKHVDDMEAMCYHINTALISALRADEGATAKVKERLFDYLLAAKTFVVNRLPRTEDEFVRTHRLKPRQECDQFWTLPSLPELPPPQPEAPNRLDLSSLSADDPGNGFFVASDSERGSSESSSGLTCWPPRQFESGQEHRPKRDANALRPELPEFAKKPPPPPPSDEVSRAKLPASALAEPEEHSANKPAGKREGMSSSNFPAKGEQQRESSAASASAASRGAEPRSSGGAGHAASAAQQHQQQRSGIEQATSTAASDTAATVSSSGSASEGPAPCDPVSSDSSTPVAHSEGANGTAAAAAALPLATVSSTSRPQGHVSAVSALPAGIDFSQVHCLSDTVPVEKDMSLLLSTLNPELFAKHDFASDLAVGHRGELCVYHYLTKKHESAISQKRLKIDWVNAGGETGLPYDLTIVDLAGKDATSYVEVKSTRTEDKCCMELSAQQLQFGLAEGKNYSIYRVYNAASPKVTEIKLRILLNFASLLKEKQVGLFIIV